MPTERTSLIADDLIVRRILSITGTRADYGLMEPVFRAIAGDKRLALHLVVTGMHQMPEFESSLSEVRNDKFGVLHEIKASARDDSGKAMAEAIGQGIFDVAGVLAEVTPDIVLLQGDRGEMLAGAIAAAHMDFPIVHMSGGDYSGSIDDSARNAISKLSHFHLTNCSASSQRLAAMGEAPERIAEIGDPALDRLRTLDFLPFDLLAKELRLPAGRPFLLATLHPVVGETGQAASQMKTMLEAIVELGMPAVITYPNNDAGGGAMRDVLERWKDNPLLRVVPNLGSRRYLSLLRHAAAMIGNSSSGIVEAPTLKIPAINIGSRQYNRLRAGNVIEVASERDAIVKAVRFALDDPGFRRQLAATVSPYGDGHAAERAVDILNRLKLGAELKAKWRPPSGPFLAA